MNKLYVAFLWHMHQPLYKDPLSGRYTLPWVRLHSTKGYYDMVSILEGFPKIRQTFNLVPSLMKQIEDYAAGTATDDFLDLSRKPAEDLTESERVFVLQNFFAANWDTMVLIHPRYRTLLDKRGRRVSRRELEERHKAFSSNDMRDLQVWFNLTWFGHAARDKDRELQQLLLKRGSFSEEEKQLVLDKQIEIVRDVLPRYRAAQDSGQIEVTISPFYHPILPLLCDFGSAREAMPNIALPRERFRHPEDARRHVESAVSYYESIFGRKPRGMWPSEGSVSTEAAKIVGEAGVKWIATDEDILLNTIKRDRLPELLYAPYELDIDGVSLGIVFRDRNLSDLIGFSYSKSDPQAAATDLVTHLRNIHTALGRQSGEALVSIILDGENPWEYYPDGGRLFLTTLYSMLSAANWVEATTVGDYLERFPPRMKLQRIFSGSWISHNFNIWIGRREDNLAWDLLAQTRNHLEREQKQRTDLAPEALQEAWDSLAAAEGSDWFWWYGDDFNSAFDLEFDRLFRSHLMRVHTALGEEIPDYLSQPIVHVGAARPTEQPTGFLSPTIDGRVTHFYEWVAAGSFDVRAAGGTMNISETLISRIYWGFDTKTLFLRIDPSASPFEPEFHEARLTVHFDTDRRRQFQIELPQAAGQRGRVLIFEPANGDSWQQVGADDRLGVEKILELAVDFARLGAKEGDDIKFYVTIHKGNIEIERWPRQGHILFPKPGADFEATMWFV